MAAGVYQTARATAARARCHQDGNQGTIALCEPGEAATERFVREAVTLPGVSIPKGELVLTVLASPNRDEAQFTRPDALDLARQPNRHLAFKQSAHYCLGAPLARLERQLAIPTLRRLPGLRLSVLPDKLRWRPTFVVWGLEASLVRF